MLKSLIKKEALHILRDWRTVVIVLVMPVILLLLFGFAISMEVNDVRVVMAVDAHSERSRRLAAAIDANPCFIFSGLVNERQIEPLMRGGRADIALVGRNGRWQIIADASNPVIARSAAAYVSSVVTETSSPQPLAVTVHTLYNPSLRSAYNFVPGILGMIFILVCAIMTSVSIVSEKESGSMDMLLVSPARPGLIILGKLIPYFILSCVLLALMLAISYIVLGLPFSAESLGSIILSLIYIVLSLSIGLLVSTLVATQLSALIVSAMLFMIPVIMLSGMIFPIDNMPQPLQWISTIVPARWYIEAMRRVMIQQLPLAAVWRELAMLGAMTLVLLSLAITKFRSRQ